LGDCRVTNIYKTSSIESVFTLLNVCSRLMVDAFVIVESLLSMTLHAK